MNGETGPISPAPQPDADAQPIEGQVEEEFQAFLERMTAPPSRPNPRAVMGIPQDGGAFLSESAIRESVDVAIAKNLAIAKVRLNPHERRQVRAAAVRGFDAGTPSWPRGRKSAHWDRHVMARDNNRFSRSVKAQGVFSNRLSCRQPRPFHCSSAPKRLISTPRPPGASGHSV